ncbi:MAG: alginate export family protein [Planctomycetota bacterium]
MLEKKTYTLAAACTVASAWAAGHSLAQGVPVSEIVGDGSADAASSPEATFSDDPMSAIEQFFMDGKVNANIRLRYEYADQDGLRSSNAWTGRLRLGYHTADLFGFSAMAEFEATGTPDEDSYFAGPRGTPGRTIIADPTNVELNQLFAQYFYEADDSPLSVKARVGRQRIILDNSRFIGNVGWRQNEQTFDAAYIETSLIEGLVLRGGHIEQVNRIFGNDVEAGPFDNFDSHSQFVNVSYDALDIGGFKPGKLVGFVYIFDFDNAAVNSVNSYGLLLTGSQPINDDVKLAYSASYAFQTDGSNNPRGAYLAHYGAAEGKLVFKGFDFGGGYELLGADDGNQFLTPLATLHKFNGFADRFLAGATANGGPNGLQDFYGFVGVTLPWEIKARAWYHAFATADQMEYVGSEIDFVLSKKLSKHFTVLFKYANFFDGEGYIASTGAGIGMPDIQRASIQLDFAF